MVDFISVPVTSAFTSATSLIIIGAQLKNFVGLKFSSKRFADTLYELTTRLGSSSLGDGLLSLVCCVFLLAFRVSLSLFQVMKYLFFSLCIIVQSLKDIKLDESSSRGKLIKKILWYFSISSNALLVLITSIISYQYVAGTTPFRLSGISQNNLFNFF